MKNEKIITSWNRLNPDEEGKKRIMDEITHKKRRPAFQSVLTAAAAVICLIVIGSLFLTPDNANVFSLNAYALDLQEDGSIGLCEVDVLNQPDIWGGHFDGENFYVSVGLKYEGENIKSVDFTTADGFFAKQHISNLLDEEEITKLYVGSDDLLVMAGDDFEIAGNKITLDSGTIADDLLLFWGIKATNMNEVPKTVQINATATFYDGKTDELSLTIDLSGTGIFIFDEELMLSEEMSELLDENRLEYYDNLPLEKCELLPDTVKTVTDVYEYEVSANVGCYYIDAEHMEFDENNMFRGGWWTDENGEVFIIVIKRDDHGILTGMVYQVPESSIYIPE